MSMSRAAVPSDLLFERRVYRPAARSEEPALPIQCADVIVLEMLLGCDVLRSVFSCPFSFSKQIWA